MDIQVISFILALVVGGLCFGLVKHAADEFDRWYDDQGTHRMIRVPAVVISGIALLGVILLVSAVL